MTVLDKPKYEQIKQRLISQIRSRQWPAGSPFPSEAQLLTQYNVSRPTLVRSLQELVREGYIYRRKGQGTFVGDISARPQEPLATLPVYVIQKDADSSGDDRLVLEGLLRGIDRIARKHRSNMTLMPEPSGPLTDATRRRLEADPPRVALVIEPSFFPEVCGLLESLGTQICAVNESRDACFSVAVDQEYAGYLATRHLLNQGRRRIALLNGKTSGFWGFRARKQGYLRALGEAGVEPDPAWMREMNAPIDTEAGRAMMRSILEEGVKVDGVVGVTDRKAIGASAAAREAGIEVPRDIQFVGIDNTVAQRVEPPLSSVAMPFEEVGARAAQQAFEMLDPQADPNAVKTRLFLQPWCVNRD